MGPDSNITSFVADEMEINKEAHEVELDEQVHNAKLDNQVHNAELDENVHEVDVDKEVHNREVNEQEVEVELDEQVHDVKLDTEAHEVGPPSCITQMDHNHVFEEQLPEESIQENLVLHDLTMDRAELHTHESPGVSIDEAALHLEDSLGEMENVSDTGMETRMRLRSLVKQVRISASFIAEILLRSP